MSRLVRLVVWLNSSMSESGAFKPTEEPAGGWAHVVCTLYLDGAGFRAAETRERAAGFDLAPMLQATTTHIDFDATSSRWVPDD